MMIGRSLRSLRSLRAFSSAARAGRTSAVKVGDTLPDVSFDLGFPPEKVGLKQLCEKHKRFVVVGLPGAFTPT